ncbi:MAG: M24 family metallopeptidase [Deltaproteobacteria bacterium]|nr:M24 family metallopeptidase [Deltaproteobacteria bacterium]
MLRKGARLSRISHEMRSWGVDGVLFTGLENIRYLTGFTGSSGALLVTGQDALFLTDSRYKVQAHEEVKGCRILCYRSLIDGITEQVVIAGIERVGFEGGEVSYDNFVRFSERLERCTFVSLSRELERIRSIKERREIDCIKRAIGLANSGFTLAAERIAPGIAEKDIASMIEEEVRAGGADGIAFDIIVASGERAALPHGKASDKVIEKGDFVIVDMGVSLGGYNSDETRTFVVGKPSARQKRIYQIVKEGHDKAIDAVKPGAKASDIDAVARGAIRRRKMGKYFGHGTGHGVGIAIHEAPTISPSSRDLLEEGMVFTVEPGVYIPGWGGVRIEDMVLVTELGCDVLTTGSKELTVL